MKLKAEKSFLRFSPLEHKTKTEKWLVSNAASGHVLGEIRWYAPWRRYVFYPRMSLLFDAGCLGEVREFLDRKMRERKE